MPFGALIGSASGSSTATGTTVSTSTALTVSVGDLVVAVFAIRAASITSVTFSDNLSNTWTNLTNNTGTAEIFAAFSLVTASGSMTPKATYASTSQDQCIVAGQYSGPFTASPLDVNPATTSGSTSGTENGPATGTLAQASELLVCYAGTASAAAITAVSPFALDVQIGAGSGTKQCSANLEHEVVSATTSVTPQWTVATTWAIGVASFKASVVADVLQSQILM